MRFTAAVLLIAAASCRPAAPLPEAVSLLGEDLFAPELPADLLEARTAQLMEAETAYDANPDDADALIWRGRRIAYLGRYRDAIETFTTGVNDHPDDARMYRHRGHRYLSTRQVPEAIADFEHAATLITGQPDVVEPDGQPNRLNIPTSTLQSNIWYHLGLSYFITRDYDKALGAYEAGQLVSRNDDMRIAMTYWHVMTLTRLGRTDEATALLGTVTPDNEVIENGIYRDLLLLFKGDLALDDIVDTSGDDDVALANATVGYGIGFWHEMNGRAEEALATWRRTIAGDASWAGFGYIASEAEVAQR